MSEELDRVWLDKERLKIYNREHPLRAPKDMDTFHTLGSDLNGVYEREHKPKGM